MILKAGRKHEEVQERTADQKGEWEGGDMIVQEVYPERDAFGQAPNFVSLTLLLKISHMLLGV